MHYQNSVKSEFLSIAVETTKEVFNQTLDPMSTLVCSLTRSGHQLWSLTLVFHSAIPELNNPLLVGDILSAGQTPLVYRALHAVGLDTKSFFSPVVTTRVTCESTAARSQYTLVSKFETPL